MAKKNKSALQINLEFWAALLAIKFIECMSLHAAYRFIGLIARVFFALDFRHRRRAIQHIMHAGLAADHASAKELARKNFIHLGKVIVETIKMREYLTPESVHERFKLNLTPAAKEFLFSKDNPQQAIIVTAHYGNWEVSGMSYVLLSTRPMLTIMRPLDNPKIGAYLYRQREAFNHTICPKEGALKPLLGAIKNGSSVCIISDQHASRTEGVETSFFGHPARTHASPAMLHLRTGIPIIAGGARRLDDDFHFEFVAADPIIFKPTGDKEGDIKKVAQIYTSVLEDMIRKCPEQWMWAHRRWLDINRKSSAPAETANEEKQ